MRRSRPWLRAFWNRAYRENVTGLSAMVAYNLLLAVFPFALLVLFVFGQVLKIGGVETSVLNDLQRLFPNVEQHTLTDVLNRIEENSTTIGIAAFFGSLWIGASFWGAMDTAFCRIYHVECRGWVEQKRFSFAMLAVVLLFIAASILVPTMESALVSSTDRLPFGLSDIKAIDTVLLLGAAILITFAVCCVIFWAVPKGHMPWRAVWPGAAFVTARRRHRQLALPGLPLQRLQPLALRLDPRLHPDRPALVLRAQPGDHGRRGDQLTAPRAARDRRDALRGLEHPSALEGLRLRLGLRAKKGPVQTVDDLQADRPAAADLQPLRGAADEGVEPVRRGAANPAFGLRLELRGAIRDPPRVDRERTPAERRSESSPP